MKKIYLFMAAGLIAATVTSCKDNDDVTPPNPDKPTVSAGAFILNQGNSYSNIEGGLFAIDYSNGNVDANVFKTANGRSLGNTPQCGIAYGSNIYIGVFESNTIEVISRADYKTVKQIQLGKDKTGFDGTAPRSMAAKDGKVYISMYDGFVCRLDTAKMALDASVQVGNNPEKIAIYNNRLYVPNSDGMSYPNYGKTASEIDLGTFTVSRTFEVGLNPSQFLVNEDGLYVLCLGNYNDVPGMIYRVGSDYKLTEIAAATMAAAGDDELFLINAPYYGDGISYNVYDTDDNKLKEWTMNQKPDYPSGIAVDEVGDKILVSSYVMNGQWPSYDAPGYVNVYDEDNFLFIRKYTIGSGPTCIFFNAK